MKKIAVALLILGALAALAYFAGSSLLEKAIVAGVEGFGPDMTLTPVELESVDLALLAGTSSIRGLVVGNPDGFSSEYSIRLGALDVKMQPGSLLSDKIVIESLEIDAAQIIYEVKIGGTNIARMLKNVESYVGSPAATDAAESGEGKKYEVRLLRLTNARVSLAVAGLAGEPITVILPPIELKDMGSGPNGVTLGEVARAALAAINVETIAAAAQSGKSVGSQLQRATGTIKEGVDGLLDRLKQE